MARGEWHALSLTASRDRILCWELCSKRDSAWVLHYVKSAQAVTDVPDQVRSSGVSGV